MTPLKDQVRDFVEFSEDKAHFWYINNNDSVDGYKAYPFANGAEWQHTRLAPLLSLMPDIVEALENLRKRHNWHPDLGECVCKEHIEAQQTLAKIKAVLGDRGNV